MIGETVSHYRILEELGAGGMGIVYRARDEHLPRDVALKVLPSGLFSDETARSRFRREAQTLSQLNHPNIATVYDFDRENGVDFLVMEFVEGETLAAKIAAGPLAERKVITLGTQIAEALEEAHELGIIHRDLKPGNVMVTAKGRAKVLDFGLAKLLKPAEAEAATASLAETQAGTMMGTVPYMSPEQLQGKPADARTDVYALGAVLYEMATGRRPFPEAQTSQLIAAILTQSPPPARELNDRVSHGLEAIIQKALERSPNQRYPSAKELVEDLARLSVPGSVVAARRRTTARRWAAVASITAVVLALLIFAYWLARPLPPPRIIRTVPLTNTGQPKGDRLVTDGLRVYFVETVAGKPSLNQVSVTGRDVSPVPTQGGAGPRLIDISPDGSQLLVDNTPGCTECPLKIMPTLGGIPRPVGSIIAQFAAWTPDGRKIVYNRGKDLFLAERDGSESHKLVTAPGLALDPRWSPDGRRLRFTVLDPQWEVRQIWEVSADGANLHRVLPTWTEPHWGGDWTADGRYFVFLSHHEDSGTLWAIREKKGPFQWRSGDPVRLTFGPTGFLTAVCARSGRMIFAMSGQPRGELVRYDRIRRQPVPFLSGISADGVDFSRDGKWVTYSTWPEGNIWRSRSDGSERLQLTFSPMLAMAPRWSPDGTHIAFLETLLNEKGWKIYLISAEGGTPQAFIPEGSNEGEPQWSPDGNRILFAVHFVAAAARPFAVRLYDLKTKRTSTIPGSEGLESARWSRDGRYLVAWDRVANTLQLFDFMTQRWEILAKPGGRNPIWSKDGQHVYFIPQDTPSIVRVSIDSRTVERVASLEKLPPIRWLGLAPDDSLLMLRDTGTQEIYALELEAQ
jgi:Tol biopolymer transport system component/predicted Ser/Thr protein kinase